MGWRVILRTVKKAVKSFNSMATDINLTSALPSLRSAANATSSRMHELFLPPILETPRSAGHLWARAGRVSPQHFSARDSAPAREHWLLVELLLRSVVSQTGFYWCVFVFGQVDCTTRVSKLSLWLKKNQICLSLFWRLWIPNALEGDSAHCSSVP